MPHDASSDFAEESAHPVISLGDAAPATGVWPDEPAEGLDGLRHLAVAQGLIEERHLARDGHRWQRPPAGALRSGRCVAEKSLDGATVADDAAAGAHLVPIRGPTIMVGRVVLREREKLPPADAAANLVGCRPGHHVPEGAVARAALLEREDGRQVVADGEDDVVVSGDAAANTSEAQKFHTSLLHMHRLPELPAALHDERPPGRVRPLWPQERHAADARNLVAGAAPLWRGQLRQPQALPQCSSPSVVEVALRGGERAPDDAA